MSPDGATEFDGLARRDAPDQAGGAVTFAARPGTTRLVLAATTADGHVNDRDERTIEVPDSTGPAVALSTPLLFRARTAHDIQRVKAAPAPLPTTAREFTRAERLLVRFYARGPAGTTPAVTIRICNSLGETRADLPAPIVTAEGWLEAEIGLASLAAGDYVIEIMARGAGEQAAAMVAMRITG